MEVYEAVRTLLAVRSYEDKPLPQEAVRRIIQAGRLTGSSRNRQSWHFIVVENRETLQQLGAMAQTGPYIAEAAMAVVVVIERTPPAAADGGRAIQSMLLTAWGEGIGSNWVGVRGLEGAKSLLSIPDDLDLLAILPFGYPDQPVGQGKKQRKPLVEVAHRESFDRPFE